MKVGPFNGAYETLHNCLPDLCVRRTLWISGNPEALTVTFRIISSASLIGTGCNYLPALSLIRALLYLNFLIPVEFELETLTILENFEYFIMFVAIKSFPAEEVTCRVQFQFQLLTTVCTIGKSLSAAAKGACIALLPNGLWNESVYKVSNCVLLSNLLFLWVFVHFRQSVTVESEITHDDMGGIQLKSGKKEIWRYVRKVSPFTYTPASIWFVWALKRLSVIAGHY